MPARIRLARHGRKRRPFYHIIVADSRSKRDGRYIERIGSYNPNTDPATVDLDFDRALYWTQTGAEVTNTCRSILSKEGVMYKKHLLLGVKKGALTEEQAELKYNEWKEKKDAKNQSYVDRLQKAADEDHAKRMAAETKIRNDRAQELAKKNAAFAEVLGIKIAEEKPKAQEQEQAAEETGAEEAANTEEATETKE